MKRVLSFFALMLLPLSLMAMSEVTDQTLSDVTGQAGVTITSDLTIDLNINSVGWGDADGIGGTSTAGWVGLTGLNLTGLHLTGAQTIDVATDDTYGTDITFVRMGLSGLGLSIPNGFAASVKLAASSAALATSDQVLGQVYLGLYQITFGAGSYVDIYAGHACGVVQAININFSEFDIDTIAWGDTDGYAGATGAGWVGISGLTIDNPTVVGTVSINVGTAAGVTGVCQTFDDLTVSVGSLTGSVVLSSARELTPTATNVLGDIYISGCSATINGTQVITAH